MRDNERDIYIKRQTDREWREKEVYRESGREQSKTVEIVQPSRRHDILKGMF